MTAVIAVLALALAAALATACVFLFLALWAVRRRAAQLSARVAELSPAPPQPLDLEEAFGRGQRRLIVVEILNPIELATSRTRAAGFLAALAPEKLRKTVVEQAVRQMQVDLPAEGVEAEVRIHAAR